MQYAVVMSFVTFWPHLTASVVSLKQIMEHVLFTSNVEHRKGDERDEIAFY